MVTLSVGVLKDLTHVIELSLSHNKFVNFEPNAIKLLKKVHTLSLGGNRITNIMLVLPDDDAKNEKAKEISLRYNNINQIHKNTFAN